MKRKSIKETAEEYMDFPHEDDNNWVYLSTKDIIQYPSPLEVKMMIENALMAERESIKTSLRGKEITVTDGDGSKETVLRVGNFLATLEDWPDLPETTY